MERDWGEGGLRRVGRVEREGEIQNTHWLDQV